MILIADYALPNVDISFYEFSIQNRMTVGYSEMKNINLKIIWGMSSGNRK